MFKRKKKKTGAQTPEFRKPTPPPMPLVKPPRTKTPNTESSVQHPCPLQTPCGWCTKWDKKCDKKIGCDDEKPQRGLRAKGNFIDDPADAQVDITKLMKSKDPVLEHIKSGKGLPPLK